MFTDLSLEIPGDSKHVYAFLKGCGISSMWSKFKTEMFIYQSKANLDVKILLSNTLSNITH